MKKKNIVKHGMWLNLDDPEQNEMDKFLKTFTNVSAKLKYLVLAEMRRVPQIVSVPPENTFSPSSNFVNTQSTVLEEEKSIPSFALDLLI